MKIEEKTTGTRSALACAPLELVEFIIQNAQDKEFLLSQKGGKKSRDFLASALDGGRVDIAELLIKNGVEFKQDYLKELRYAWSDILDIEAQTKKFECLGIKKGETLKKIWDLLSPFSIGEIYTEGFSYYDAVHNYRKTFTGAQQVFIYVLKNKLFSEEVLEYALFLGLHKGRKNAQGKDFESFLQDKIEEYKILTTKGNKYGMIFEEDEWDLAYFLSLQKFMQGLESLEKGEAVVVDDETFKMFARIEEIPRNLLV
ncbi:hypothetical protein [Helicobacter typhlonius]|uniref:hypothetical protein n=1 Tax=Helicobacter typhlonius TaxID=76936 RepID=UPI002FE2F341